MLVIIRDSKDTTVLKKVLQDGTYHIGRDPKCDLVLDRKTISSRHAVLKVANSRVFVRDAGSRNGTFFDGKLLLPDTEIELPEGKPLFFGTQDGFSLVWMKEKKEAAGLATPPPEIEEPKLISLGIYKPAPPRQWDDVQLRQFEEVAAFKRRIHQELHDRLNIRKLEAEGITPEQLKARAKECVITLVGEKKRELPSWITEGQIIKEILSEALGLGPLEEFLADTSVTEIMVNGKDQIYIERNGKLERTDKRFSSEEQVLLVIQRIVSSVGRRIDEQQPYVDARLDDGSRVNAIIRPLALGGPSITIRKFPNKHLTIGDLIRLGSMNVPIAQFLLFCVESRQNIVISGGTGSGKTTLLNVLSSFIPPGERIVTIEDSAELRLAQPHVVCLQARPKNIEGKGEVTIRDLVRNALRMRPDRIVVGECRGGEALDMLQAMNTGHDGSLTTVHANSCRDALSRLETMCLMSGLDLPHRAIREQIKSAVNIIIQQSRMSDGSRKIVNIAEITGMEGDTITMQDLFVFEREGISPEGKVLGTFKAMGCIPKFITRLREEGIEIPLDIFMAG